MKKKELYEAPLVEVFEVRTEGRILTVSSTGNTIDNATMDSWGDTEQDYL